MCFLFVQRPLIHHHRPEEGCHRARGAGGREGGQHQLGVREPEMISSRGRTHSNTWSPSIKCDAAKKATSGLLSCAHVSDVSLSPSTLVCLSKPAPQDSKCQQYTHKRHLVTWLSKRPSWILHCVSPCFMAAAPPAASGSNLVWTKWNQSITEVLVHLRQLQPGSSSSVDAQ